MEYVNLTDHIVRLMDEHGAVIRELEPSGDVARVEASDREVIDIEEQVKRYRIGKRAIVGLPKPKKGTIYIVSKVVLSALNGRRRDVFAPYKRIKVGRTVIGAGGLVQFKRAQKGVPIEGRSEGSCRTNN